MIEVAFSESEAAVIREAKGKFTDEKRREKVSFRSGEKRKENLEKVICLAFLLDIGDIRKPVDSEYRRNLIFSMYHQDQWRDDSGQTAVRELKKAGDLYVSGLNRLETYLDAGEPVRIWYGDAPYAQCGFSFLCHRMKGRRNPVSAVKLPEQELRGAPAVGCSSWGEMDPEELPRCLKYEKPVSEKERDMHSAVWSGLMRENSPLRANINGRLLGVSEDFYDFLIFREMSEEPAKQAFVIGKILGNHPIGIRDWWYAKRIDFLIEQGKIRVTEEPEMGKYSRSICLTKRSGPGKR